MKRANISIATFTPEQRRIILSMKRHALEPYRTRVDWPKVIFWAAYLGFFSWLALLLVNFLKHV